MSPSQDDALPPTGPLHRESSRRSASRSPITGVTGATGVVGGRVARLLADADVEQRLLVRDPARAPDLPGATVARASYGADARDALSGVSTLFMVSASESATRRAEHLGFIDAAVAAGVEHVVYLSFFRAAEYSTFLLGLDHFATEQHLRASGLRWTFLRDNLYADFMVRLAGEDGVIRGPAGRGRLAAVAQADVADCAAAVLTAPARHVGSTYELTGPSSFSLEEAASTLTTALGRPFTYHDETLEEAYASRAGFGAEPWQVDAWVSTYTAIAAGELDGPTDDVRRLTGREPRSPAEVFGAD